MKHTHWSEATQHTFINAIKFYYEKVLRQPRNLANLRPRRPAQLPHVFSPEEIVKLMQEVNNLKHKCILMLIYSAGLRLSELVNLRKDDVLYGTRQIFIKSGKGKKDRYSILSEKIVTLLSQYLKQYQPSYWLFEGMK